MQVETTEVKTEVPEETKQTYDEAKIASIIEENERLKAHQQKLLDEKKAADRKAKEIEQEAARKSGDIEAIEKSLRDLYEPKISEYEGAIKKRDAILQQLMVNDQSTKLAAELAVDSDSIPVLSEYIRNRLAVQEASGEFKTVVMGDDGKPTALTLDEFRKNIEGNKALARLLKGSQSTGGGAAGAQGGGATQKTISRTDFDKKTPSEKMALMKAGVKLI